MRLVSRRVGNRRRDDCGWRHVGPSLILSASTQFGSRCVRMTGLVCYPPLLCYDSDTIYQQPLIV